MQSMSVQTAQVNALAGQIRTGARGIRTEMDRLESEVGKLRGAWSGESQTAYDVAQRKWTQSVAEMQALLERIAGNTEQIAQTYDQTDTRGANRFTA